MMLRGGSSKGAYFLADDLPVDPDARDELLLGIMGSPDARQIDGIGGAHPLTSKVAIVGPSTRPDADVEYLFLQVGVDQAQVSDRQNCGNLLAGVGPFALERGLITAAGSDSSSASNSDPDSEVSVAIHMLNTDSVATATFPTADGQPVYNGETAISGVPGTAAPIRLDFEDIAGSSTGALLPTGGVRTTLGATAGVAVDATLVDNGMPVVVVRADAVGITGYESCTELETNDQLRAVIEAIRLEAGPLMNLGDVWDTTVPKVTMVAPPVDGGALCTRTFIPHRCHEAIGVLGAVSVATAALLPGSPASEVAEFNGDNTQVVLEHPTGHFIATIEIESSGPGNEPTVKRAGIIRTARKLFDGTTFPRC